MLLRATSLQNSSTRTYTTPHDTTPPSKSNAHPKSKKCLFLKRPPLSLFTLSLVRLFPFRLHGRKKKLSVLKYQHQHPPRESGPSTFLTRYYHFLLFFTQ